MIRRLIFVIGLLMTVAACNTIKYEAPYEVIRAPLPQSMRTLPLERIEAIIARGVMSGERTWTVSRTTPGVIDARLDSRAQRVEARITITQNDYSLHYGFGENVKHKGALIDRRVNLWLKSLDNNIRIALAREQNI